MLGLVRQGSSLHHNKEVNEKMTSKELPEKIAEATEIAEILAYLKSLGYSFEGESKGFLKCLLVMNSPQPHRNAM